MHKLTRCLNSFAVTLAVIFTTATATAAVNNLEGYLFRFDFSKGTNEFLSSPGYENFDFVGANTVPTNGPNGASSAATITNNAWKAFETTTTLSNSWTIATSLSPASEANAVVFSVGRLNGKNQNRAVAICTSADKSKLLVRLVYNNKGTYTCDEKEMTGLGDITQGFHTLVIAYTSAANNKGSLTFYWDGVSKLTQTYSDTKPFGIPSYPGGVQFNSLISRGSELSTGGKNFVYKNGIHSFYDFRFYSAAFAAADATAYAALYPADRMGSPFRPNAYIEASGTNTISANVGNTIDTGYKVGTMDEVAVDFQYLDLTRQARIFGMYNGSTSTANVNADGLVNGLYINGSDGFAFCRFSSYGSGATGSWATFKDAGGTLSTADRIRRVLTVKNKDGTTTGSTAKIVKFSDRSDVLTGSSTLAHSTAAKRNTYLFANNEKDSVVNQCVARIYSFAVDGTNAPAMFLAPGLSSVGAAGFIDVVARGKGAVESDYFKGERNDSPAHTLRFYNGVGCASDYKYENDTLYAKLYATSDENGAVRIAGGAAAASAEGWIPRGGTLALSAVPAANMEFKEWIGDTWAIEDGYGATDASIEVSTPYAVQLQATFKPAVNALLTVAADGASAVSWSAADWRNAEDDSETISAPIDKEVTIVAHKSFTLTVDQTVSLSKFTVTGDVDCVVTLAPGNGSFLATEVVVKGGVFKLGGDNVLGKTPKVTVEDGGTIDMNGKTVGDGEATAGNVVTEFHIAGAGAGSYPWALTSYADMASSKNVGMLYLDADATIGGAKEQWIGVRDWAAWDKDNKNVNLGGHTLTKTGSGILNIRRPYSGTGGGTIDVQSGTLKITDWSNADVAYGESCVSNIALVVREGTTVVNDMQYGKTQYTLYFKSLDMRGATMTSSYGAFGAWETLSGHGAIEKLAMADGAPALLDGNLAVSGELTASGALALTRRAGVETNVTVAATGTLTASGTITVGAGVIFNIGANRPTGTLTVDDDATLVLRQANLDEDEIVVKASAQPQNIALYDINGEEVPNPEVSYDADVGTVTVRVPTPVWTNADGTGSFSAAENWSLGAVPREGRSFRMSLDGNTTVILDSDYGFGNVLIAGTGSVGFDGAGSLTLAKVLLTNGVSFAACGRVTAAELDLPIGSAATLTTLDGVAAGGVTGVGTLELAPGAAEAVTISGLSSFTGDFTVTPYHSMTGTLTCAATKLNKFIVNGAVNAVFTLVKGTGGSIKASEVVVAGGVLQQGSATALGDTPKITVQDGGTFDINAKTIRQETPIYIAGAGAGNWPWALASSAGSMASGNYLFDLYLTADATIGAGQFKIGRDDDESYIYLNGHTLKATSWLTLRNVNTQAGTIDLQNSATLNKWNNLNTTSSKYSGTTLIVYEGHYVQNKTNRKIKISNLILYGGSITDDGNAVQTFGIINELHGHGTITQLEMEKGAKFYPDGEDYLNVTKSLSGNIKVDISDPALKGKVKIPVLAFPNGLTNTYDSAVLDLTDVPQSWELKSKQGNDNVEYYLLHKDFTIFIR